jgi:uncharacterized membrane protein
MREEVNSVDSVFWSDTPFLILGAIVIIGIIVIWIIGREVKSGFPLNDERSDKIKGKAALKAYYVGIVFLAAEGLWLTLGKEFLNLPQPEAGWMLIAAMLALGLSFGAFSLYYSREDETQ